MPGSKTPMCLGVGDEAVAGGVLLLIFLVVGRVKSVRWIAACESAQTKPLSLFQEYNGVPPVPPVVLLLFRQLESAASARFHSLRQTLAARATCPAVATTGPTGTDAPAPRRRPLEVNFHMIPRIPGEKNALVSVFAIAFFRRGDQSQTIDYCLRWDLNCVSVICSGARE